MTHLPNHPPAALIIVDAQRCFMPAAEGERLAMPGFGELGVAGGENLVAPINRLTQIFRAANNIIATTQDQHPEHTAHFGNPPNFVDTWPVHGRMGTPGGELHPELTVAQHPDLAVKFIKGDLVAATPAEDDSYTGALAHNDAGEKLPAFLRRQKIDQVYVCGIGVGDGKDRPYCADSTAIDLYQAGFKVTVVTDATVAIRGDTGPCWQNLRQLGIKLRPLAELESELDPAIINLSLLA